LWHQLAAECPAEDRGLEAVEKGGRLQDQGARYLATIYRLLRAMM
jgi:hypothetical protein